MNEGVFWVAVILVVLGIVVWGRMVNGILGPVCGRFGFDVNRTAAFVGKVLVGLGVMNLGGGI